MMVWGCISWMISPVVQSFLMTTGPDTAEAGVGLNLSAMHVGVALGTAVGRLTLGPCRRRPCRRSQPWWPAWRWW